MKPSKLIWTQQFKDLYKGKTLAHRKAIQRALRMMNQDLYHRSLRTRKMEGHGDIKEAHVTKQQVMTLTVHGSAVHLRVCCSHDQVYRKP